MKKWYRFYLLLLLVIPSLIPDGWTRRDTRAFHRQQPALLVVQANSKEASRVHWLGTTQSGQDVLGMIMQGGRLSVMIGFLSALCAAVLGILLGTLAAYRGQLWESTLQFTSTGMIAFPKFLMLVLFTTWLNPSLATLIMLLAVFSWIPFAMISRATVLRLREENFVHHAAISGTSPFKIFIRHLLPHIAHSIRPLFISCCATCILAESTLSFLGLGLPPGTPSWGSLIAEGRYDLSAWWIWLPPSLLLFVLIYPLNIAINPVSAETKINRI